MGEHGLPLELKLGLRPGCVFYFRARDLTSGEPHFFVVVNREPLKSTVLLLTIVTSKVDKVRFRNRTRSHTVVEISPTDYADFTVLSAVDCNVVVEKPLLELAGMVRRKEVRYHADLPHHVFEKIKAAILASPIVVDEVKEML